MAIAKINGIDIYYEEEGNNKDTVIFLNGIMMSVPAWREQANYFKRHYHCVFHDFRGQLMSEKPTTPFGFKDHAEDLNALMDHLNIESAHLVGTSYGAATALVFAQYHPTRVKSLSVISAMMKSNAHIQAMFEGWKRIAKNAPAELFAATLSDNYSADFLEKNAELIIQYEQWYRKVATQEYTDALIIMAENVAKQDITASCRAIDHPTLVLTGTEDIMTRPSCADKLHKNIKNSELILLPDAGHAITIEKPTTINTIVHGFMEDHS